MRFSTACVPVTYGMCWSRNDGWPAADPRDSASCGASSERSARLTESIDSVSCDASRDLSSDLDRLQALHNFPSGQSSASGHRGSLVDHVTQQGTADSRVNLNFTPSHLSVGVSFAQNQLPRYQSQGSVPVSPQTRSPSQPTLCAVCAGPCPGPHTCF